MTHADDVTYLRDEMSPAVFEAVLHEWAGRLRDLRREAETRIGNGNGDIQIRQEVKGGHPAKTWVPQPDKCFEKRNGLTQSVP